MRVTVTGTRFVSDRLHRWSRALRGSARSTQRLERIVRREIPYWRERGWVRHGHIYTGSYQTPYGAFRGHVERQPAGDFRFYLRDIPPALTWSSHWPCFQPRGVNGFLVHMAHKPMDMSSGILTIERLLVEALESQ
jgi:hypothetical protein